MTDAAAAAGKTYTICKMQNAKDCLHPSLSQPPNPTPPNIKKFTNTDAGRPEVGVIRRHWAKSFDSEHIENLHNMSHGLKSVVSIPASELLNPPMRTLFEDVKLADSEAIYKSKKNAPLGSSATPIAPVDEKFKNIGFGRKTEKGENAGRTVNPKKDYKTVEQEDRAGHELYVKTHNDYYVGEQINRDYHGDWNKCGNMVFGVETPHYNDGRAVCRSLKWPAPDVGESADRFGFSKPNSKTNNVGKTKLVSKRVDEFRERTQPQLGMVHDPIKSTKGLPETEANDNSLGFGLMLKPDGCGAGDIMHQRNKSTWLLGHDRHRGLLAAVRQHLKKANYHNFKTLKSAFEFYDKNNDGKIGARELKTACAQFNLPVDETLLAALMKICENENNEGYIDYTSFVNLLNWKNKMPKDPDMEILNDPKVIQQIDKSVGHHKTSSSMINATVGGVKTDGWHTYGVPTVRSDIPNPLIRRVSDNTNYGDELNAHGLLSPSIFTNHGVFESDFFEPRDQKTIKMIFSKIGVNMNEESWERCWQEARKMQNEYNQNLKVNHRDAGDKVSVECFRLVLDRISSDVITQ